MSSPIPQNHYRLVFPGGQTQDLVDTHSFFKSEYGKVMKQERSEDRTIQIEQTKAVFQKYVAATRRTVPHFGHEADFFQVFQVADAFSDLNALKNVKMVAKKRFGIQGVERKAADEQLTQEERHFWDHMKMLMEPSVVEQRLERIMGKLKDQIPDYAKARFEREGGVINENHAEENSRSLEQILERIHESDFLSLLSRYYLLKSNPINDLKKDLPQIMNQIEGLDDRDKQRLFRALFDLAAICFEEEERKSNSENRFENPGEWFKTLKNIFYSIKTFFPLGQVSYPWKAMRSVQKYESVTQTILQRVTRRMDEEKAQVLRNRISHLQLEAQYHWEEERGRYSLRRRIVASRVGRLRYTTIKRVLLETVRRVTAIGLSIVTIGGLISFRKELLNILHEALVLAFQTGPLFAGVSIMIMLAGAVVLALLAPWITDKIGLDGWMTFEVLEWVDFLLIGLTLRMMWINPTHIVRVGQQYFGLPLRLFGVFLLLAEGAFLAMIEDSKSDYYMSPQTKKINRWIEWFTDPLASLLSGYWPQDDHLDHVLRRRTNPMSIEQILAQFSSIGPKSK